MLEETLKCTPQELFRIVNSLMTTSYTKPTWTAVPSMPSIIVVFLFSPRSDNVLFKTTFSLYVPLNTYMVALVEACSCALVMFW